jgi:Putative heavy-metal-binding
MDFEISTGDIDRPYRVLGPIKARVTSGAAWNKARTTEDVDSKLRETALKMGANAVINVSYQRGISATSWKALTATGTAVVAESDERKCPFCAEMVKREAKVCRHCGRDLPADDTSPQPTQA